MIKKPEDCLYPSDTLEAAAQVSREATRKGPRQLPADLADRQARDLCPADYYRAAEALGLDTPHRSVIESEQAAWEAAEAAKAGKSAGGEER